MSLKTFKYRLYPTGEQKVLIDKHFGCVRFVYNYAISKQMESIKETQKILPSRTIQNAVVAMKSSPGYEWMYEVNSQSILAAIIHAQSSAVNFRVRKKSAGKSQSMRFKSKKDNYQKYQCPQKTKVKFDENKIWLPKLLDVKARITQQFTGKIKTSTITKTPTGQYFVCVLVETEETLPIPTTISKEETLGIDVGINHFATLSNGLKIANEKHFVQRQARLAKKQKIFARKQKGSKNYGKEKLSVAKEHEKIRLQRLDFQHKLTHQLIRKNQATTYAIETLNIEGIKANRKLAKAVSDAAWYQFTTLLKYKASWYGKNVIAIDRFEPSSKVCSCCGHKLQVLPLHIRKWECPSCLSTHDRDINAAINIRNIATANALG